MYTHGRWGGVLTAVLVLAGGAGAQEAVRLAPPLAADREAGDEQEAIFHWQEIPQGQQVVLARASFDKAGYQLYDTVGETIIVPFVGDNLYVMKFGRSTSGSLYFVNEGGQPTLYVPDSGYLENATTAGGRWYPFPQQFQPTQPVYMGIAPSYTDYARMGWYPNMTYSGGYYSATPYVTGTTFAASPGLFFQIGNQPYYGWGAYSSYYQAHPYFSPIVVYRPSYYRWANRPRTSLRPFGSGSTVYYAHRPFGGNRPFRDNRPLLNGILPSARVTGRPSLSPRYDNSGGYNRYNGYNSYNRYNGATENGVRVFRGGTTVPQTDRPTFNGRADNGRIPNPSLYRGRNGVENRPSWRGSNGNFSRPNGGSQNSGRPGGGFRPSGGGSGRRGR